MCLFLFVKINRKPTDMKWVNVKAHFFAYKLVGKIKQAVLIKHDWNADGKTWKLSIISIVIPSMNSNRILTHTHESMAVMYHDEMMEMLTHHTENCRDRKKPKWSRKPHVNNKLNLVETFGNDFGPVRLFTVWKNLMQNKLATVTENEVEFGAFTYSILISGWLNVLQTESHIYMTLWSLLRSKMAVVELWTLSNPFLFSSHRSLTTSSMSFAV